MKKLLIGTSALVALGALPAVAMADAPELSISGAVDMVYSVADTESVDGDGLAVGNSSTQLIFDWKGSSDNGLTYGARLDYRFQSTNVDEQYVYLSGGWGTLHIGGDDGIVGNTVSGGESVLVGEGGYDGNNLANSSAGAVSVGAGLANDTDDDMKFTYYTPSFGGFSGGVSYVPNDNNGSAATGSGVVNSGTTATPDNPQFEIAAAYEGSFDAVGLKASAGYATQEGTDGQEDNAGYELGLKVSFAGFSAGIGYIDDMDTGCASNATSCSGATKITTGVAYSFGPGGVSLGYAVAEQETTDGDDDETYVSLDADYKVADGLKAFTGVHGAWSEDATGGRNSTLQFLVGMNVSF